MSRVHNLLVCFWGDRILVAWQPTGRVAMEVVSLFINKVL